MQSVDKFTGVVAGSNSLHWLDFVYYRYALVTLAR